MNESEQKARAEKQTRTGASMCPLCGAALSPEDLSGLCPVCLLRTDLDPENAENRIREEATAALPETDPRRFAHYEILRRADGHLHELGHGAMGITFKAIDLNLRIPIALKVLNLRLFQEEAARRRFFREARAAASVRHPNVASVYHLGFRGRDIFYAMEFVEGETLENLILRSGRLDPRQAVEIAGQIAAGLAAIHRQHLVHRDIKPSNVMVGRADEGAMSAKIIDLGLAKGATDESLAGDISVPGVFAGTPTYASPEQFAGVGVDIRSDLYSLGVTLWKMLSGQPPFLGTPAEIMHQHQHAPLPLARFANVPEPLLALLKKLLEKGPAHRFQSPTELLTALEQVRNTVKLEVKEAPPVSELPSTPASTRPKTTEDLGAYDLYLRGVALVELLDRQANEKAIDFFKRAIEKDPNFALAYCGLARAYVEQDGFVDDKSLLDSAVQHCRMAIALDPTEVRGYEQLGRVYYAKGWYPQCDKALQKALELGPHDGRANALAAMRQVAKHEFGEAYKFFRKACSADSEPRFVYYAAKILFGADLKDVADRWIEQALERESNPQRHHMMECYGAMWRGQFDVAAAGFAQLPFDLKNYDYSVQDGLFFCAIGTQNWAAVIRYCNGPLRPENVWTKTYLAIALNESGRQARARELAKEIVQAGSQRLERPGQPDVPWDIPICVAWGYRCLENNPNAYRYLRRYLANRTLLHLPLGLKDPILHVFGDDSEFQEILAQMDAKFDVVRRAIREGEAGTVGDSSYVF